MPFSDADGNIERYVSMRFDITPLKLSEQALRDGEAMLERTGRMAGVGGWSLDFRTSEMRWSAETFRIHGPPVGQAPSLQEAINHYAPEARWVLHGLVEASMRGPVPWEVELPLVRADGSSIWVRAIGVGNSRARRPCAWSARSRT